MKTRKAVRDRKPPPTPCCSPRGITIFGSGFPYLPMVKKSENQNPGFLPDHPQNLITCSFCHSQHSLKISEKYFHNFLSYHANTQTNKLRQKHNLLGGGNDILCTLTVASWV